ncbi:MAG TPA: PilZ domain-containing protein [Blastocatellia bacterium]|nr:PilZ domain-containing protein [Blastocatellia bacterium]
MQERRRSSRKYLLTEVRWEGQGSRAVNRISDIGVHGVFIDTMNPMPIGANLTFTFDIPATHHHVQTSGVVVQSQPNIGMGVQFTALAPEDEQHIREFVGF